jgi:hypothetical protein
MVAGDFCSMEITGPIFLRANLPGTVCPLVITVISFKIIPNLYTYQIGKIQLYSRPVSFVCSVLGIASTTTQEKISETSGESEEDLSNHIQIEPLTTAKPRGRSKSWADMDTKLEKLNAIEKKTDNSGEVPADKYPHHKRHHHGRRRHRHHHRHRTTVPTTTTTAKIPLTATPVRPQPRTTIKTHASKAPTVAPSTQTIENYVTEVPVFQTTGLKEITTLIPESSDVTTMGEVGAEAAKSLHLNIEVTKGASGDGRNNWDEPEIINEYITMPPDRFPSQSKTAATEKPVKSQTKTFTLPTMTKLTHREGDVVNIEEEVIEPGDDVIEDKEQEESTDSTIPASEIKIVPEVKVISKVKSIPKVKAKIYAPQEEPYKWIPLYWSQVSI